MTLSISICIPTFNRAGFIAATLDSILPQLGPADEVIVVDGGSTDGTAEVVRRYSDQDPRVRLDAQAVNDGVDRDMDRSVRDARSTYCWLTSSDDLLLPGAIDRLRPQLADGPDFVIVNAEIRNFDMTQVIRPRVLLTDADATFSRGDDERFFRAVASYLSFMGGVVVRRDLWLQRIREELYGTEFIHLYVLLERGIEREAKLIARPGVAIRYGNFTWAPRMLEISMYKWPSTIWSLPGYSDEVKATICPRGGWREIPRLLYHRSLGGFSGMQAREYVRRRRPSFGLAAVARLVAIVPSRLLNLLAIVFYSRRPGGGDTVYLLRTCAAYWRH